jgi:hypothetical protein
MGVKEKRMEDFEIGDIVWYETGLFTASKAKIVGVEGHGAVKTYIVHFLDHSPDQSDGSDSNTHHYWSGGIPISARKCKRVVNEDDMK